METIGARIRRRRESLGMTQEELGAALRLNKSSVQRYESGQVQRIKRPILNAIAEALSVDPLWLLGGSNAAAMQNENEERTGMDTAEKIKSLRKKNNLTLEEVGNACGVGKSTVRKWEVGAIESMRCDKIAALAAVLQTTPAYLMGWGECTVASDQKLTAQELALLKLFKALDVVNQARLLAYAADLKK